MGRREVNLHDRERWVFNRLAQAYRARPGYPDGLVRRLVELAGGVGRRVADLGAGTGHLAVPLAAGGLEVTAVEPAHAMLAELAARAPEVEARHAAAEDTGLAAGRYDLVLVADALHWIDAELAGREIARILRPGGVCVVVEVRLADTPFLQALSTAMIEQNPRAHAHSGRDPSHLFALATPKVAPASETFCHEVALGSEELADVLCSLSYVGPALGPAASAALITRALALAQAHGGAIWSRVFTLTWARCRVTRSRELR